MKLNHSHNPIFRQWMSRPLWSIWRFVHTTICLFWNIWKCTSKMQWWGRFSIINDVWRSTGTNVQMSTCRYLMTHLYCNILIICYLHVLLCYRKMFKRISMTKKPRFQCSIPLNICGLEQTIGQLKKTGNGGTHILILMVRYKFKLNATVNNRSDSLKIL